MKDDLLKFVEHCRHLVKQASGKYVILRGFGLETATDTVEHRTG
jgi:hypothetical protein